MSLEVAVAVANKYEVSIGGERNHSGALSIDFADGLGVKDVVLDPPHPKLKRPTRIGTMIRFTSSPLFELLVLLAFSYDDACRVV